MHCPKCSCARKVKNGIVKGKQRYRCSDCGCNYTLSSRYRLPESLRKQAIQLYLEGLGFRSIERILGVSNVTIMRWIRDAGQALRSIKRPDHGHIRVMEIDEMWHYVGKKNKKSGCGLLMIEIEDKSLISNSVGVISPPDIGSSKD